jgi:putative acetyltransferase
LADNWYKLKRIELEVYVDNEIAINLYKKFGFNIEGKMKCYAIKNGKFVDAYLMARIK